MKLVIVGGVAAGATAAARARRLDESAEITILEKGPYISFANCGLPYRLSGDIGKRSALILQTAEGFFSRYRVNVLLETEAYAIDRAARLVHARGPQGERALAYDKLILAQGGSPLVPKVDGVDSPNVFRLWTIPDMDRINNYLTESGAQSAVVVGGGFIGLETAEAFIKRGLSTSIVELTDQLMPPADPEFGAQIEKAFVEAGANVYVKKSLRKIDAPHRVVELSDGSMLPADIVLLSAGVRPNLELAKAAGLEIGASGGLVVDEFLRTGDENIFAAGDMVEVVRRVDGARARIPLAGPANRQGRIAVTNALGGSVKYAGVLGTSVFKAVEYTFAQTGLSEKTAKAAGIDARAVHIHKAHHASYYPGHKDLSIKLVYTKEGKLLGAQAFGREGVEKRIDVLATALAAKMTLADLAELDLAYAPPYSTANDPIQMAAFAAQNDLSGFSPFMLPGEAVRRASVRRAAAGLASALRGGEEASDVFLDVRTYGDYLKGHLPGSRHIPLDELRDRLEELPADGKIIVVSPAGFEGHLAVRILKQSGFSNVEYVTGGIASMRLVKGYEETTEE